MADTHTASVEEANAARLPLGYRDQCSAYVFESTLDTQQKSREKIGVLTRNKDLSLMCSDDRLLIPLNKCRKQTLYAPWKCEDER